MARSLLQQSGRKRRDEIEYALKVGILMFNVESSQELQAINEVAGRIGKKAPIAIRVNPDIDPKTHPYISTGLKQNKFGIDILRAPIAYRMASQLPHLRIVGIDCHIGSQLVEVEPGHFARCLRIEEPRSKRSRFQS